jgi:predicted O-methyltransferase YrrM
VNIYRTRKYLNYKLFSSHKKGHGIHSPFLFNLIVKVFRNKSNSDIVLSIEKVRRRLLSDHTEIEVTDYGTGGSRRQARRRKVSDLASKSAVSKKYGRLLSNLSSEFGNSCILELGTSLGLGAMYLSGGAPDAEVHTVEGCPEISSLAENNFKTAGFDKITVHTGRFDDVLPGLLKSGLKPGVIFIDGDHKKESVLRYFEILLTVTDDKTVMIFDDIDSTSGMGEAWESIRNDGRVKLAVDIGRMGLVFFRKGLYPMSFVIRY